MDAHMISNLLAETLHPSTQKNAEQQLSLAENHPHLAIQLLQLVSQNETNPSVRLAAVLYLKNYLKKKWPLTEEEESKILSFETRELMKSNLIEAMLSTPASIQSHLSEMISMIASFDFPDKWQNLLPTLVSRLSDTDYAMNLGILKTAHAIFKRYRHEFRSDALFAEINYVLEHFASPLLHLYQTTDAYIERLHTNQEALTILFNSLFLLNKLFYSLSAQDIPAFFEDHLVQFMTLLKKYLTWRSPLLESDASDQVGLLEKVQSSVCEIIYLYAQRYEEELTMLPELVQNILHLLATTPLYSKYDLLISTALNVVTVVAKKPQYQAFFENMDTLHIICEKIILPNIQMRDSDEELFECETLDYVRHELEGSETDSRRRASEDLIRSFMQAHGARIANLLTVYIKNCIQTYYHTKNANQTAWKQKDAALHVFMAMTIRTQTALKGATSLTEGSGDLAAFFNEHVKEDLNPEMQSHPILVMDAIQYCLVFRNQLPRDLLNSLFPIIAKQLHARHAAIISYAAVFLERSLASPDRSLVHEWTRALGPIAEQLLNLLRGETGSNRIVENEFIMRALLRLILIAPSDLVPLPPLLILAQSLIASQSMNPKFSYYLFESLASLMKRTLPGQSPSAQQTVQTLSLPLLQMILQSDVIEFMPYALCLASLLIEHSPSVSESGLLFLLEPLLQPSLWSQPANIPALVRLLESFMMKEPRLLDSTHHGSILEGSLGICQLLLSMKLYDHYGFELLRMIILQSHLSSLKPYLVPLFMRILQRVQSNKTPKLQKCFSLFLSHTIVFLGPTPSTGSHTLISLLDQEIQPGLFGMLAEAFLLGPQAAIAADAREQKLLSTALGCLLSAPIVLASYPHLWPRFFDTWRTLQSTTPRTLAPSEPEDLLESEEGQGCGQRLRSINHDLLAPSVDALPEPSAALVDSLKQNPTLLTQAMGSGPATMLEAMQHLFTKHQVYFPLSS